MKDRVELRADGILHIVVIGEQTSEDVRFASAESDRLIRENGLEKIRYLVDFSNVGRIAPSARQALRERIDRMQYKGTIRYAILGVTPVLSAVLEMFRKAIRPRAALKFFQDEGEAVAWLKGVSEDA